MSSSDNNGSKLLQDGGQLVAVLRSSLSSGGARLATAGIGFLFNLVLARTFGADQTGLFFIALAIATVAGVISRLGLDNAVLRQASVRVAAQEWPELKSIYISSVAVVTVTASIIAVCLNFSSGWMVSEIFDSPGLETPLRYMGLSVLPLSLLSLHSQFLKSVKLIGTALFVQNAAISAVCLGVLLVGPNIPTLDSFTRVYLGSATVICLVILAFWLVSSPVLQFKRGRWPVSGELFGSGGSFYLSSLINQIVLPWAAIVFLGAWGADAEAGQYAISRRLAMFISFGYLAVESMTGPRFAALFGRQDMAAVRDLACRASLLMVAVAVPIAAVFITAPVWVMSWFGPDFESGWLILVILACGQLINALTGSVANLLLMSGNDVYFRNASFLAGATNLLLCVWLIPLLGGVGAAIAAAASVAALNLTGLLIVWRRLGFLPFPALQGSNSRRSSQD